MSLDPEAQRALEDARAKFADVGGLKNPENKPGLTAAAMMKMLEAILFEVSALRTDIKKRR